MSSNAYYSISSFTSNFWECHSDGQQATQLLKQRLVGSFSVIMMIGAHRQRLQCPARSTKIFENRARGPSYGLKSSNKHC